MTANTPAPSTSDDTPIALVTGASRGLGLALATALAARGWHLVVDARGGDALTAAAEALATTTTVDAVVGDVADPDHRDALADAIAAAGGLDLLVNNASLLGPSPLPRLEDLDADELRSVLEANVVAPLALFRTLVDHLRDGATILNVSSDAAVEAYEGWGGYGASKAALDHLSAVLAVERPDLHVHAVDPGDMRTQMHQDAFPGEDISDRPLPDEVVPVLVALIEAALPSGRHRALDLAEQLDQRDQAVVA